MNNILWNLQEVTLNGAKGIRLNALTLEIKSGFTAVMGPSGAGKSSLLNILVGFEKSDKGTIDNMISKKEHLTDIYWVPVNHGLWPHLTVMEHIQMVSKKNMKISEILNKFGIIDKRDVRPPELSQGERSRLSIARALAARPAVIIMDEPLLNIDSLLKQQCWNALTDYCIEYAISVVYASHSPRYVIGTAEQVICLSEGKLAYVGKVDDLYFNPPSNELAEHLGTINCFSEEDQNFSLNIINYNGSSLLRPEQISITTDDKGSYEVRESIFRGEVTETVLVNKKNGSSKKIVHRVPGKLKKGAIISIAVEKAVK